MLLCGCGKQTEVTPVLNGFECEFSVSNSDFSGELSVLSNNTCVLKFHSPSELSGTMITVRQDTLTVDSNGYKFDFDYSNSTHYSFAIDLQKSLVGYNDSDEVNISFNELGFPVEINTFSKNFWREAWACFPN
jgi:hypothetical protein